MGRKAGLSTDDVLAAATVVADREGLPELTLARLARELGVRSPSLYNHVDGLDGLHRELAARSATELGRRFRRAIEGRRGEAAFRAMADAYRDFGRRSPGQFSSLLQTRALAADDHLWLSTVEAMQPVTETLAELGFDDDSVLVALRVVRASLSGFVSLEINEGFAPPLDLDEAYEGLVDVLLVGLHTLALDQAG